MVGEGDGRRECRVEKEEEQEGRCSSHRFLKRQN